MTKKELVQELEKYDDDQYVYIRMHKDDPADCLIGIDCHVENRPLKRDER